MRLKIRHLILALVLGASAIGGTVSLHNHATSVAPASHTFAGSSLPPPPDPLSVTYHS